MSPRIDGNSGTGGTLVDRAVPVPTKPVAIRPTVRRATSPFGDPNTPTPPDPDAITRLIRAGHLTAAPPEQDGGPAIVTRAKRGSNAKPRTNGRGCAWRRADIDIEKAVALYQSGLSLREVGRQMGVGYSTIRARFAPLDVSLRQPLAVDHDRIVQLAKEGLTGTEIARAVDVALPTVTKYLQRAGVKARRGTPRPANARDDLDWDAIRAKYESGVTTPTLARDHGCSTRTVRDRLIGMGVVLRDDRHLKARAS